MFQQWFWYRIGDTGPESSLDTLPLTTEENPAANKIHLLYTGSILLVDVLYTLTGGTAGSGWSEIQEVVKIKNTSPSTINLRWFEYTDLDLDGTALGDSASFWIDKVIQTDSSKATVSSSAMISRWEIGTFRSVRNKLTDGDADDLANGTSPLGPADITHAFQYNYQLAPSAFAQINKTKKITVPEPRTLLLLGSGLVGLVTWACRRRGRPKASQGR